MVMTDASTSRVRRAGRRFAPFCFLLGLLAAAPAAAQQQGEGVAPPSPASTTNEELLRELKLLRQEVQEAKGLKDQVEGLKRELGALRRDQSVLPAAAPTVGMPATLPPGTAIVPPGMAPATAMPSPAPIGDLPSADPGFIEEELTVHHSGPASHPARVSPDSKPVHSEYKYQVGTGPHGGGGYFHFSDDDDEFTVNLTNQITVDGTFYDRQNIPTNEKGFNVPFARSFLYGNITKDWQYQVGVQGSLGSFNLLDLWMSYRFSDALSLRVGKGLAPPLYEYYAFSPALEPVITNSPLFQLAAKRPIGAMFSGTLFDHRVQYWSGVSNGAASTFYALHRNVEYNGAIDITPFKETDTAFEGLGAGVGFSAGEQDYKLNQGDGIGFTNNGEATTNASFVTSVGVPFFAYNPDVRTQGMRTVVAPHVYYYGRLSILAEYINFSRVLADRNTIGRSTQRGYYVNASYYLTGESDFKGNGFQGYATTEPLKPFIPSKGLYGPGAIQIAAQYAELNVGDGDFARGFADPTRFTNRMEQVMVGINWWPNRYTRLSFDYMWTWFNRAIPITGPEPIDSFNTFWFRYAMFF
jgi:phosphate-selective porin OprO/OprP